MTTPYLRTRALVLTKEFLQRLSSLGDDAVPLALAAEAEALLKHYPTLQDIETAHKSNPEMFGPAPPFQRMPVNPEVQGAIDAAREVGVHYPSLRECGKAGVLLE